MHAEQVLASDSLPATFASFVIAWGKELLKPNVGYLSFGNGLKNLAV